MGGKYAGYFSHETTTEKKRKNSFDVENESKCIFSHWLARSLALSPSLWWRALFSEIDVKSFTKKNIHINWMIYLNMTIKLDIRVCWRDSGNREKRDEEPRDEPRVTKRMVWGTKKKSDELWLLMVKLWSYAFL